MFEHAFNLMSTFTLNANPDIFRIIYSGFVLVKDYESRCFKIINKHYLDNIMQNKK